jgi:molybdopterin-guanine dinucleotide biosynthesis protein A
MKDLAVVILAGGEGRRIGGAKPLREFAGDRLIDRALRLAAAWSDAIAIAVRDSSQVGEQQARLIADDPDVEGPLGGLIAGLRFARSADRKLLLTVPADMPFLPHDLPNRLRGAIGDGSCALAASGGHVHPVCGLWRSSALGLVPDYVQSGRRSLRGFAELVGFEAVDWAGGASDPFFNVNTIEDLAAGERRAGA